jgi:WW domain-containing oxidoreductase
MMLFVGYETARALAMHGAFVIFACRDMRSARDAVNAVKKERPAAHVEAMFMDLTSLRTVEQFANSYINRQLLV